MNKIKIKNCVFEFDVKKKWNQKNEFFLFKR